jgi:KipI family sensor histidine kinase inhibitor
VNPGIIPLSDTALLLRLGDRLDAGLNARVHALAEALRASLPEAIEDIVPGYASLAVFLDAGAVADGRAHPADIESWLGWALENLDAKATHAAPRLVEIPVCYGGDSGPDLETLAAELALPQETLVERHCSAEYRVALLGFAPGFPYLLGLDPSLAAPRLATPRAAVPAGSVGIAGAQTGIYPRESPGGWRLIGRTPLRLFDAAREAPSLLMPGDRLRFVPIDAARFRALEREA